MKEFGISQTVAILPISLFLMGLGTGPLLVGPLSEVHGMMHDLRSSITVHIEFSSGRNPVYLGSFTGFFIFSWPVAFAPNAGEYSFSPDSTSPSPYPPHYLSRPYLLPFFNRSLRRCIPVRCWRHCQRPVHFLKNWIVSTSPTFAGPCHMQMVAP